jgi:diguanylate cyclase (GGDEF)-like protein
MSLLMVDVNRFKQVNDTYGHQVGDEALKLVAQVLSSSIRIPTSAPDWAVTISPSFFLILTARTLARSASASSDAGTARPVKAGDRSLPVGLSVGIGTSRATRSSSTA